MRGATMKRNMVLIALAGLAGVFIAASENTVPTSAKPADAYTIGWYTIDNGGAMNVLGETYSLGGTIGLPDAGSLSGGGYTLNSGFWSGVESQFKVFLPLILRR